MYLKQTSWNDVQYYIYDDDDNQIGIIYMELGMTERKRRKLLRRLMNGEAKISRTKA